MCVSGDQRLRERLCDVGRRLYERRLTSGAGGSVSARCADGKSALIKPSGFSLADLRPEQVVRVDLGGRVLEGKYKPSSDTPWHLLIYAGRPEVGAIVHAHPPVCGGFACAGVSLDVPTFTEVVIQLGRIPFMDYATPTTADYARLVAESMRGAEALLMRNHGTVTVGASLEQAFQRTELLEDFARLVLVARLLGGPQPLPDEEVQRLRTLDAERLRMRLARELYE